MSKWFLRFANRLISLSLGVCLAVSVLYAGYALWDNRQIYASAENQLGEFSPDFDPEAAASQDQPAEDKAPAPDAEGADPAAAAETKETQQQAPKSELDQLFERLKAINEDIGAWIKMPGTAIDYPVVQGRNNISYLSTDIYGHFAIVGSIYLDSRNQKDYSDLYSLLYGHNMSEHRMFSDVNLYKDEDFFNENQKGYIYFHTGAHVLQAVAVIVTPASNSWLFNPLSWRSADDEKILELTRKDAVLLSKTGIKALKKKLAQRAEDETVEIHLVALSTCSNEYTDARTILLTLMDPPELTQEELEAEDEDTETVSSEPAENPPETPAEEPEAER